MRPARRPERARTDPGFPPPLPRRARRSPRQRAILACLHAARAGVALLLMLIAMTFNVGLFLAVLVGYAAGNAAVNGRKGSEEVTPACCE